MAFRILILCLILFIIEIYAFQAVKTITKVAWIKTIYLIISISVIVFIGYQFTKFDRSVGQTKMTMITLGLLLLFFIHFRMSSTEENNCTGVKHHVNGLPWCQGSGDILEPAHAVARGEPTDNRGRQQNDR